jgi:2-oxoglutarate dehydrogenase E2 component (dihydrolipoamide succinyltransferase)
MSKRLTIALVGSAALVGCGVVAVSDNEGDAVVEPARAAVAPEQTASTDAGGREGAAPAAVRWRSAAELPALAPRRRAVRAANPRSGAAAAGQPAAAPPAATAPVAPAATPAAPAPAPAAPAPAPAAPAPVAPTAPPAPPPSAPAPRPTAPPVDFLSSG